MEEEGEGDGALTVDLGMGLVGVGKGGRSFLNLMLFGEKEKSGELCVIIRIKKMECSNALRPSGKNAETLCEAEGEGAGEKELGCRTSHVSSSRVLKE